MFKKLSDSVRSLSKLIKRECLQLFGNLHKIKLPSRAAISRAMPGWLISLFFHLLVFIILALLVKSPSREPGIELIISPPSRPDEDLALSEPAPPLDLGDIPEDEEFILPEADPETNISDPPFSIANDKSSAPVSPDSTTLSPEPLPSEKILSPQGAIGGQELAGRGEKSRAKLVRSGGGSASSEAAVASALKWFAAHQNSDGSWNLDHRLGPCQNRCSHPGLRNDAPNGATALALLPYLGAGQTHREGEYRKEVDAGIKYLVQNLKIVGNRGSLYDAGGNYYSHGLSAIVLCEAYAMTGDKSLLKPAQMAIHETVYAQDPIGGGWRYQPQQRGDTSALGWQLMALKSAHLAYLNVPSQTYPGAAKFLDSVQAEGGAKYGYLEPGTTKATTAVGLLSRMYLGWQRDHPALVQGVEFLSREGPSQSDMYYNYYATQVMHHYGGDAWKAWNEAMREYLVRTQSQLGHEKGSWYFEGGGHSGQVGGRLYATSMATMILEIYYRYLPLYGEEAMGEDFPL